MSPLWGHAVGVITTVLMLLFLAIWIWAWQGRHRRVFDQMAKLPMLDEDGVDEPGLDDARFDGLRRDGDRPRAVDRHGDKGAAPAASRVSDEGDRP